MKLPDRFQFRAKGEPAYTHTAKLVQGKYQVKWARGFERHFMEKHYLKKFADAEWDVNSAERQAENGSWLVVDEAPQEQSLPDEFYFINSCDMLCTAKKTLNGFHIENCEQDHQVDMTAKEVKGWIDRGYWKILDKRPLTPEQQRANKEAREQIAQLNSSIRISEQNVEHQLRLQASYRERIEILNSKIVEGN